MLEPEGEKTGMTTAVTKTGAQVEVHNYESIVKQLESAPSRSIHLHGMPLAARSGRSSRSGSSSDPMLKSE